MKNRLTSRFIAYSVISTVLVFILTSSAMLLFFFSTRSADPKEPRNIAQQFPKYLIEQQSQISLSDEGKQILDDAGAWIQIIDKYGNEVFEYSKPDSAPYSYMPYQIADISLQSKDGRTVFVSGHAGYTILLSFDEEQVQKLSISVSTPGFGFIGSLLLILLVSGIVVYLVMSRLFIKKFTGPISLMMTKINQIGDYSPQKGAVNSGGLYQEVFSNLTELENKIEQAKQERQKFDQKRNEWIANISHDIKTPLSSIKGYAELIADNKYTLSKNEYDKYSVTIIKNADYIANLVNDLSLEMKLLSDKHLLAIQKVRLNDVIRDEIEFIQNDNHFAERDVRFSESHEAEWDIDPVLFQRALDNIVINALKYSGEDSTVVISLNLAENGHPAISVIDNGRGMTDSEIENLFTRYFRGENTDQIEGSGLGMSIAKNIIEAHNGTIKVESRPGIGTTVSIML